MSSQLSSYRTGVVLHCVSAVFIAFIFMFPVMFNSWTNWDDSFYVINNEIVKAFDWTHWWRIFDPSMRVFDTYTPLTLLSLAFDYEISGLNPTWYHSINLCLHLVNSYLIFKLCNFLKLDLRVSTLVTILFGIHPLHVESVAWITERKDLLFTFFYLLSILEYLKNFSPISEKWKKHKNISAHLLWSLFFFILSMLSKPQAMTLPITLLLFDYWNHRKFSTIIILEKLPYFFIALIFGVISLYYQQGYPYSVDIWERIQLSAVALVVYFTKFFLPINLSAFYPFSEFQVERLNMSFYLAAASFFGLIILAIWQRNRYRFIVFGVGFFIIHLLPILHLVKVNSSLIYERFTYLSYIGLSFSLALLLEFLTKKHFRDWGKWYYLITLFVSLILGYLTFQRTKVWENSETLWTDVIDKYPADYLAYGHRANYYAQQNNIPAALNDYDVCLTLNSSFALGWNNRGLLHYQLENPSRAIHDFSKAIPFDNSFYEYRFNRITTYLTVDSLDLAIEDLKFILSRSPEMIRAHIYMGTVYSRMEDHEQSLTHYDKVLKLVPQHRRALLERAIANLHLNRAKQTIQDLDLYLNLEPNNAWAYFYRSQAWKMLKEYSFAKRDAALAQGLGLKIDSYYLNALD